jgi:hypothetical protein
MVDKDAPAEKQGKETRCPDRTFFCIERRATAQDDLGMDGDFGISRDGQPMTIVQLADRKKTFAYMPKDKDFTSEILPSEFARFQCHR